MRSLHRLPLFLLALVPFTAQAAPTVYQRARAAQAQVAQTGSTVNKGALLAERSSDGLIDVTQSRMRNGVKTSTQMKFDGSGKLRSVYTLSFKKSGMEAREYKPAGEFNVEGIGRGTALVQSDKSGVAIRFQFEPGEKPVLDGKRRVTFVVGPAEGWTPESKTIEVGSLGIRGDLAHAYISANKISSTFGDAKIATYARIDEPGQPTRYINLNGEGGKNFPIN